MFLIFKFRTSSSNYKSFCFTPAFLLNYVFTDIVQGNEKGNSISIGYIDLAEVKNQKKKKKSMKRKGRKNQAFLV